jgi:hypothetical protein
VLEIAALLFAFAASITLGAASSDLRALIFPVAVISDHEKPAPWIGQAVIILGAIAGIVVALFTVLAYLKISK